MADPYRGRSRHTEHSSGARHGQYQLAQPAPSSHYAYPTPAQYYPAPRSPGSSQSTYGYYSTSSSSRPEESGGVHRHSAYPAPAISASPAERASKRHKGGATPQSAFEQVQWANAPAHRDPRYPASQSRDSSGSRHGRESSVSSGYNSPGYSNSHDPYGQLHQYPSIPGVDPSAMRDARLYSVIQSQNTSSEYEEEEERLDHGPTELPPRTYSGKSKYNPPRKPGKIPGSAMDYLPILEARFDRLETAIDKYVDYRGQRALSNSILPGMDAHEASSSHYSRPSRRRDVA